MVCPKCGRSVPVDNLLCVYCGSDLPAQRREWQSPAVPERVAEPRRTVEPHAPAGTRPSGIGSARMVYYWANLILNPLALLLVFVPSASDELRYWCFGWVLFSALLNPHLWGCLGQSAAMLIGAIIMVVGAGSIAALIVGLLFLVVGASVVAAVLFVALDVYLWIRALIAIREGM